jgi:Phosphotransacetylase
VDIVVEATRIAKERAPELLLEGPLQYDAAIDPDVARTKLPDSKVAGHATVFIFPDLNTGNNTYKAVQRAADAVAIGPVLQGLRKPVNDLSRGCTVADIVNTVAITACRRRWWRRSRCLRGLCPWNPLGEIISPRPPQRGMGNCKMAMLQANREPLGIYPAALCCYGRLSALSRSFFINRDFVLLHGR